MCLAEVAEHLRALALGGGHGVRLADLLLGDLEGPEALMQELVGPLELVGDGAEHVTPQ